MTPYDRLRSIGASVETADALAPILESLPDRKREAFYLWAMDVPTRQVCTICGINSVELLNILELVQGEAGEVFRI